MKTQPPHDAIFEALVNIKNTFSEKISSLDEHIQRAQLQCLESTFQQQKEAFLDCLEGIDQELMKLSVYMEESQRLYASLNSLNARMPEFGGAPLAMPAALAGDNLAAVLAGRIDHLKSQGNIQEQ